MEPYTWPKKGKFMRFIMENGLYTSYLLFLDIFGGFLDFGLANDAFLGKWS